MRTLPLTLPLPLPLPLPLRPAHARAGFAALAMLWLSGCATLSADGGFAPVEQAARERLGKDLRWVRTDADHDLIARRVGELLQQPVSADAAVQIALLNHRGLQAMFDELGIADAERVQAGRLPNPGLRIGRLRRGAEVEIERSLHLDVLRWLSLPLLAQAESRRFEQTRGAVTIAVLSLASDTRKAYYTALAADERVRYTRQVLSAAEAGAELARRQAQAGNWNKLQQLREQGFFADAALNLARAEQVSVESRERLVRLMGLWGEQVQFTLPPRLPDLPASPDELPDIEHTAMAQRLDVSAAKLGAEQLAKNLGLTQATRFVNVLELGVVHNGSNQAPAQRGYEISVELPIFDGGGARVAKAEALYRQAVNRAAETAVNARSEVRAAYAAYRTHYDIARHYRDEIVPLKKRISDENLLRYNGMLIGVFELLADARSQIGSVNASIEALRDFWLAQADLEMSLIGKAGDTPSSARTARPTMDSGAAAH